MVRVVLPRYSTTLELAEADLQAVRSLGRQMVSACVEEETSGMGLWGNTTGRPEISGQQQPVVCFLVSNVYAVFTICI